MPINTCCRLVSEITIKQLLGFSDSRRRLQHKTPKVTKPIPTREANTATTIMTVMSGPPPSPPRSGAVGMSGGIEGIGTFMLTVNGML